MKTCVLIILDGWGVGQRDFSNPIFVVKPPQIGRIKREYPAGALQAGGIAVGLPWGEEGNSEVGHLTIGAGKVIYQHYPRITMAIQDGSFFKNKAFLEAFEHVKKNNSALNIAGLLTEGNIHSSFEHLEALIEMVKANGIGKLNLHLFSDGKDSRPHSAATIVNRLKGVLEQNKIGVLASLTGRYYGLDRDGHWDRTKLAYDAMTGEISPSVESFASILERNYEQGLNDDLLEPVVFGPEAHPISDNDALIFIDFREDSIRQIAASFIVPGFNQFPVKQFKNLHCVTMTEYSDQFKVAVAFPSERVTDPLGKVLSDAGKTQLLIAETEKYAHVTYFFNGYRDESFPNQVRALIPSQNVARHDEHPEMRAAEIAARVIEGIEDQSFDFILANFANADIVAHTGNYEAAKQAILSVDEQVGRIVQAAEAKGATVVITADHGNAERMIDPLTGGIQTTHDNSPVPIYLVDARFKRSKSEAEADKAEQEVVGILSDVAPTVLELMDLKKPKEMTGSSLVRDLR